MRYIKLPGSFRAFALFHDKPSCSHRILTAPRYRQYQHMADHDNNATPQLPVALTATAPDSHPSTLPAVWQFSTKYFHRLCATINPSFAQIKEVSSLFR